MRNNLANQKNELLIIEDVEDIPRSADGAKTLLNRRTPWSDETDWVFLISFRDNIPEMNREYAASVSKNGNLRPRRVAPCNLL